LGHNAGMSVFDDLAALPRLPIWDGVVARAVEGDLVTLSVVELDPGAVIPEHAHENEQVGLLLTGSLRFRVGGEARDAVPGTMWSIPASVPHDVVIGPDGAVVIEVFAPRRDDWGAIERDEPSPPRWPSAAE
jgi:quercetin dioxygenase-like cupin family protein